MYPKNAIRPALFALGFLSIGTQIYLVREFMMVFNDNELIIGLVLAIWMLITGVGSYLGRFNWLPNKRTGFFLSLMLLAGILPSLMVAGLDVLKVMLVPYGSMADARIVTLAIILVQLPFCLLNGFLFSCLSLSSRKDSIGGSYAWESLGSMISGVLVNFLFLLFLGRFQGLLIITGVYLVLVINFAYRVGNKRQVFVILVVSMICLVFFYKIDFRALTDKLLFPSQHVISNSETPYGQVVITKNENQFNFFENGMLLFSSGNEISNEENVHYAMVQRPNPVNILLISGGFSGTLAEILKYKPIHVDYIELNPSLVGIASRFTNQIDDKSVFVHETDARRFLHNTIMRYDVVLVNLPSPSTLQLNRYYSVEFLQKVKQKMSPGAVLAYSLPTDCDYVSYKAGRMNCVLRQTLKQCFAQVLILPAGRNYFLASDSLLSADIPGLIQMRRIETVYVNRYYLDAVQLKERSDFVTKNISCDNNINSSEFINRDFTPVAVWYQMSWWLSHFETTHLFIFVIFMVILLVLLISLNPLSAGLFAGGFTLASLEIILILGFQVLCGYLFQSLGTIIMIFMLGLAVGSGAGFKILRLKTLRSYRFLQISLAFWAMLIPVVILWLNQYDNGHRMVLGVFALLSFVAAFIVGLEYKTAALLSEKALRKTVAGNYSAEMFGSSTGAFAVTFFLVPGIGMLNTGIFLMVLNLAAAGSLFLVRDNA